MPLTLVLTDLVFLERVDIGIEVIDDGFDLMRQQPFDDGTGARRTTSVQQYFVATIRNYDRFVFCHFQGAKVLLFPDICKRKANF